jgi:transposase
MRKVVLRMKEQHAYEIIKKLVDSKGNKQRAAVELGVTIRTINRMILTYTEHGKEGFVHGNRGRLPAHTLDASLQKRIVNLYKTRYIDFNYAHFLDHLKSQHNIDISYNCLYSLLTSQGILSPKARRKTIKIYRVKLKEKIEGHKHLTVIEKTLIENTSILDPKSAHPRRPRMKYSGELIQMDASDHIWFKNVKASLHVAIDDHTGMILAAHFEPQETLLGYYTILGNILLNYGIPYGIMTDNRTVFNSPQEKNPSSENHSSTQFGYACATLGIKLTTTSVPQMKGRVERAFGTLQSRLVNELNDASVSSLDEANHFLKQFIVRHNEAFALPINHNQNVFEKQMKQDQINRVLSIICNRVFDNGSSIKYNNVYYQVYDRHGERIDFERGTKCLVSKTFDGRLIASVKEKDYVLLEVKTHYDHSTELDPIVKKNVKPKKYYVPPMSHPWKEASYRQYLARKDLSD